MFLMFGGEQAPLGELEWPFIRVELAKRFGWTLEYIDGLSSEDVAAIWAVERAYHKVHETRRRK